MAKFVKAAEQSDLIEGQGHVVTLGEQEVALFRIADTVYAVDNLCPHRGGPIGEGEVDGKVVTCPWHAWTFELDTGVCTLNPAMSLRCFEVKVEGNGIYVSIPGSSLA